MTRDQHRMAVVGAGTMGSGIAIVGVLAGQSVSVVDESATALDGARQRIAGFLEGGVRRGKLTEAEAAGAQERVRFDSEIQSLAEAELVVEAVYEDLDVKQALLAALDDVCSPTTLFATNTSTLSVTAIAARSSDPTRVVGMHFCNPAPLMSLVEVVPGELTSDETTRRATEWTESLRKVAVICRDRPGFILNRVLVPFENDCIRALERGEGSVEEIDLAIREALGYPMGPFQLLDIVGMDVHRAVSMSLFTQLHDERFAPPPRVDRMIDAGHLGRKSGRGFYQYETAGMFGE